MTNVTYHTDRVHLADVDDLAWCPALEYGYTESPMHLDNIMTWAEGNGIVLDESWLEPYNDAFQTAIYVYVFTNGDVQVWAFREP